MTGESLNNLVRILERVLGIQVSERHPLAHSMLIKGGTVIDGTGAPPVKLDLAIDGAKIAKLYRRPDAKASLTIDATGKIVCPGFIDIHSHSDLFLLCNPLAESKIRQGVTTELIGNCGGSAAPAMGASKDVLLDHAKVLDIDVDWTSMDEYLLRVGNLRTSVNVATLVGTDTVRLAIMGNGSDKPSEDQMAEMNKLIAESMFQGAFGVSSGLIYAPGCFTTTDELISLASTSAAFGGFYSSHIRGEGRTLVKAVAEAIQIGREASSRVEISHHKACGRSSWGAVDTTLKMIEDARSEGVDVAFDVYPYTASCTSLDTVIPPWAREGGKDAILARLRDPSTRERIAHEFSEPSDDWEDIAAEDGWENIMVVGFKKNHNKRFENKSVEEIAKETGKDPAQTTMDLIVDEDLGVSAIFHEILEDDVMKVISHPLASIGSDGEAEAPYGPTGKSATHPRAYGTFPRVIRRYSLEKRLFTLEEAVRKMTSWPAERIGLADRGTLASGMAADVVIFDPKRIRDTATFSDSHRYPEGIEYVIVNGAVTIENGEHTKERAGLVIRHKPTAA